MVVIYLNEAANLSELKTQRGIRFLYPEIFKWLGGAVKETADRPTRSGVNKEPQAKVKG